MSWIATVGGVGYLRPASGTWGSAAAVLLAWLLHGLGGFPLLAVATLVAFFAGWWATIGHVAKVGTEDPSEVVIDEVVGQWIALWPLSVGLWHAGAAAWVFPWPGWVLAFFAFRAFDILKPGPIGWADRMETPLGVMLDDVFAGIGAAVLVALGAYIAHGVMGV